MSRPSTCDIRSSLLIAALAIAAAACGSTEPDPVERVGGEVCNRDRGCPDRQVCEVGYCTRPAAKLPAVRFQFVPPSSSGYSPQATGGVTVHTQRPLDFALEPNVTVEGTITFSGGGNSSLKGPSGPLTFERKGGDDTLFDVQTQVDDGTFSTMILPGDYDLLFSPEDYPSRTWRNFSFTANRELDADDGLSVDAESELARIQGTVVYYPQGDSSGLEPVPVPSAEVLGVSVDGRFTTTVDITSDGSTSDDEGSFSLLAYPGSGPYDLIIDPGPETVLPKVRKPSAFDVKEGTDKFLTSDKTSIGTYSHLSVDGPKPTFSFQLALPGDLSNDDVEWETTRIVAEAAPSALGGESGQKQFRRETSVEAGGRVKLALIPAKYVIWAYPPSDSPLASTKFNVDLVGGSASTLSGWKRKRTIEGRVVDTTGSPVSDARVEFWPNGLPDGKYRDRLKVSTTTGGDGTFSADLEPRDHDVVVRPPSGSGLPRHKVMIPAKKLEDGTEVDLRLPEPMLLQGSVHGASSEAARPIEGTAVSATIDRGDGRQLLGKATTDEEGRFFMIVPGPTE